MITYESWLRTNGTEELRERYVERVHSALGPEPTITYIRLDMDATADARAARAALAA